MNAFSDELLQFFKDHLKSDLRALSLKTFKFSGHSKQDILQQLLGLQKAKDKFPLFKEQAQFKFPIRRSLEQASSERLAKFKAGLMSGKSFADLTGGMGVDTYFIGQKFKVVDYVEPNDELMALAKWNFEVLGFTQVNFFQERAVQYLERQNEKCDWIYLDPSRRSEQGRVVAMENYEPNLLALWPAIRSSGKRIMVKFSPMQDLTEIEKRLKGLEKIWLLSKSGDLKEVLASFGEGAGKSVQLEVMEFGAENIELQYAGKLNPDSGEQNFSLPSSYIYEPSVGILKAGIQNFVAEQNDLFKLHPNSNIYTSNIFQEHFPGRIFKYFSTEKFQRKAIQDKIIDGRAHVISRNFPAGAEEIKKKLKLKESGNFYLIATTLLNDERRILMTERVK